jgi:hypothetical protein
VDHFDRAVWDQEIGYAARFGANTLRIWCDFVSFQRSEPHFLGAWNQALEIAQGHGLQIIVTLANRWVDPEWPFGGLDLTSVITGEPSSEYAHYLESFISAFRSDHRILMWDLCNEPFHPIWIKNPNHTGHQDPNVALELDALSELRARELDFWSSVATIVRSARPSQPITIGLHGVDAYNPVEVHDMVDVMSAHLYGGWSADQLAFRKVCDGFTQAANVRAKPALVTETFAGSKSNDKRCEIIRFCVQEFAARRLGWVGWQLMAGKMVASRWDRVDYSCEPGDEAVMYFIESDGTTRPRHDRVDWE